MSARFVISEMGVGFRRNAMMTIAAILTTAVAVVLLGVGLWLAGQVNTMKGYWYDKAEVAVFMCNGNTTGGGCAAGAVTPAQQAAIKQELSALPGIKAIYYESQQQAYENFKQQFHSEQAFVQDTKPSDLPSSFRIKLNDPTQYAVITSAMSGKPGVASVQDQRQVLAPLFLALNRLRFCAIVLALFGLVAMVLLISSAIRVAAFSRRRETGIMRLVGASNLYIQAPFLLEGALTGLIGASIGALLLIAWESVIHRWVAPLVKFTPFLGWRTGDIFPHDLMHGGVIEICVALVLLGLFVSTAASFVTLRRYLRV